MTPVHVVIGGVDESILCSIERLAEVGIKEIAPGVSNQRLRAKGRLLVNAQTRIESSQLIVYIHKSAIGAEKSDKRIFADVVLQSQYSDRRLLVEDAGKLSLRLADTCDLIRRGI